MAEAEESSGAAVQRSRKTTRVSFVAASEQWEPNNHGNRLRNAPSELVSTLGDWRSRIERTANQHPHEVTQLHQTLDTTTRMLEVHAPGKEAQWLALGEWLEDRETKWDESHRDDVL